ncbi:hypothetical protein SAMN05444266_109156 [Chitinophaga jiangningensis]|uniref:Uncharacterized protein n=1 Tax=Chitinophaga jiangningensis TaxID=1419482 RepID=A0A1M7K4Y1_9BACT|nr:hypothetical protein [Chitinophaga jiangningensis]SHM60340.1 hypothetical protein SAMN05444266_109156 [Chitinophaga jiangningensis]
MKKSSQKKLHLGKIKVSVLQNAGSANGNAATGTTCHVLCSAMCAANTSQGAPICSIDSCRF